MYKAPRGTYDILPADEPYWQYVSKKAREISLLYGYEHIETPVFEDAGLFVRSVGQGTDIVEKEMYAFEDMGGNKLALRPEGTASVCRAYLEHGMPNLPQPVKLYYITSVYRYERPQAGRYREHHQFGCEAIGDGDAALDAEVIDLAWQFFRSLGIAELTLQLNSIGCAICRPRYLAVLKEYYTSRMLQLCQDCKARFGKNPLRLLDCKQTSCQGVAEAAPESTEYLCPDCAAHFENLKVYLELLGISFSVNHRLVRGLDYYTRTVFEIQPAIGGGQSTIGGGGRYDDLLEALGGKPTPAVGFATGIERIILNLKRQKLAVPEVPKPRVFIADMGGKTRHEAIKLSAELRHAGIGVISAASGKSLRAQLRQANSQGALVSLILGEDEFKMGKVILRDMSTSEQKPVLLGDLPALLKEKLGSTRG